MLIWNYHGGGNVHTPLSPGDWLFTDPFVVNAGVVDFSPGLKAHIGTGWSAASISGAFDRPMGSYNLFYGNVESDRVNIVSFLANCTLATVQHGAVKLDKTNLAFDETLAGEFNQMLQQLLNPKVLEM